MRHLDGAVSQLGCFSKTLWLTSEWAEEPEFELFEVHRESAVPMTAMWELSLGVNDSGRKVSSVLTAVGV